MKYIKLVLGYKIISIIFLILLSACSTNVDKNIEPLKVNIVSHQEQKLILPKVDQFTSKPVKWIVVTKNNVDEKIKESTAYFVLDSIGYQNLSDNTNKMLVIIAQQKEIIRSFSNN